MYERRRDPLIFSYCHVTPGIGLDLESQKKRICEYSSRHLEPAGFKRHGFYVDFNETCEFRQRPAGRKLWRDACRGDAIVVATADRLCHSENDFLGVTTTLGRKEIGLHLARDRLDISGLDIARLNAVFQSFKSTRISQQRLETAQRAKLNGQPASGSKPVGFQWRGPKGRKKLVPNKEQRAVMARIVELRREGMRFDQITLRLEREGVRHRRYGKKPRPYSKDTIWRMFHHELLIRWLEQQNADFTHPRTVRLLLDYTQHGSAYGPARHEFEKALLADEQPDITVGWLQDETTEDSA